MDKRKKREIVSGVFRDTLEHINNTYIFLSAPLYRHRIYSGLTAHKRSRGIALLFLDHGTRKGSASRPGCSLPRERPGTHCTGGWVDLSTGLDRYRKSRPPDHPARSQSLYRLRYPSQNKYITEYVSQLTTIWTLHT